MTKITADVIKIAVLSNYRYKKQIVCADEVGFCLGNTDVSAFDDGILTEIEIKTSKSDLWQGEKAKKTKHDIYADPTPSSIERYYIPHYFFICVPTALLEEAKKWVLTTQQKYGILIYDVRNSLRPEDNIYVEKRAKPLHSTKYSDSVLKIISKRLSSDGIVLKNRLKQFCIDFKTKTCSKCHEEKFIVEFHRAQSGHDGHRSDCKRCVKLKFLKYCKANPWYKIFYNIKSRCENPRNKDWYWYGGKGIKCLLTKEEIKELWFRDNAGLMQKPSIDRKNSNGNYEFSNCQFIEQSDNSTKAQNERWTRS